MKTMNRFFFISVLILLINNFSFSQVKTDTLKTQQVTVVKSYSPSLSNAFLIPSFPSVDDSIYIKNNVLKYKILENQIVSTFEPNKAKPLKLVRQKNEALFNTSLYSGFGNKGQVLIRMFSLIPIDRNQSYGFIFNRRGYSKDVIESELNSNMNSLFMGANHILRTNEIRSDSKFSFDSNRNNFFGIYNNNLNDFFIKNLNPLISLSHFNLHNKTVFYDNVFNSLEFKIRNTYDNFNSSEQELNFNAKIKISISRSYISAQIKLNGLSSKFKKDFFDEMPIEIKNLNTGAKIEWIKINSDFKFKIGGSIDYFDKSNMFSSKLNYYPNIYFEYNKNRKLIPYLISDGKLIINSYSLLSQKNPFLAPAFKIRPTSSKFNSRVGLKSLIYSNLEFDFSIGYDDIENFTFFRRLPYSFNLEDNSYGLSNAYEARFTDLSLVDFDLKFKLNFGNNNNFLFNVKYLAYNINDESLIFNLPSIKMNFEGQISLTKRINISFISKLIGEREIVKWEYLLNQNPNLSNYEIEELPIYYKLNLNVNYKLLDELDLNVLFELTDRNGVWADFYQHKSLFLLGARYKFNL